MGVSVTASEMDVLYKGQWYSVVFEDDFTTRFGHVSRCYYCGRKRKTESWPREILKITRDETGDVVRLGTLLAHRIYAKLDRVLLASRRHCDRASCQRQYERDHLSSAQAHQSSGGA